MASHLPFQLMISSERKMCSLFRRAVRNLESWHHDRAAFRYEVALLRARFDEIKMCKDRDPDVFNQLLKNEEQELFKYQHWQPKKWPKTIGGNAYGRVPVIPDWVLDYWHPLEKAQYPKYFATREKRKEEFIKMWEEEYGKPDVCKGGHH
uniref:NADH dehydrogenase [ubiquinone] 1 beta subcomplex subunit 9 n=1 Tax=Panstrongylus megistus TaxID=65343 RepID=A0A069DPJ6_9HEMI